MKRTCLVLLLLLLAYPAAAQQNTGNIYGIVVDQDNNPLPGVNVTLSHTTMAPLSVQTNVEGRFRFRALFPANDYLIKAELSGFKPLTQSGVVVSIGTTSDIKLTMEMGKLEEQVTVVAVTPVVDAKKTSISSAMNFTALQSLPSARNPWVVLQMAPSVVVDREDIGGNESGQQSGFIAKGGGADQWTMDGMVITDPSSGGSPGYYDFDVFEEMQVTSGGMDVETQTGGILINMVTRRGGSRLSLGGRVYLTDEQFQAKPSIQTIRDKGIPYTPGYNRIRNNKDYGVNLGGPIIKDKVWLWGSFGVQDLKGNVLIGTPDATLLTNVAGKLNFQIVPENRAEIFIHSGNKEKWGRDSSASYPPGVYQSDKYHFGSPVFKIQDEHMFGDNLFLTAKFGFMDSGFNMIPMDDLNLETLCLYDYANDLRTGGGFTKYDRPHISSTLQGTYINDNLLGATHEIKFGFDYEYRKSRSQGHRPGNMYVQFNYNVPTVDWDNNGTQDVVKKDFGVDLKRVYFQSDYFGYGGQKAFAGYLNDTISFGRFNLRLGVRYDQQMPFREEYAAYRIPTGNRSDVYMENDYKVASGNMTTGTLEKIDVIFPKKSAPAVDPGYKYKLWSPRFGLTWDISGNGKTLFKINFAQYGQYRGDYSALWGYGGLGGSLNFYWWDKNSDKKIDWRELYWTDNGKKNKPMYNTWDANGNFVGNWAREMGTDEWSFWNGWEYDKPLAVVAPLTYTDMESGASLQNQTQELVVALEREILPDFGVGLNFSYRKFFDYYSSYSRYPLLDNAIRSIDDYEVAGYIPASFTDGNGVVRSLQDAAGRPWYTLKKGAKTDPTNYYRWVMMGPDRWQKYYGLDFTFNKRYSHKWGLSGSFTYQMQVGHYSEKDPDRRNDLWAFQDEPYNYDLGGASGKISQPAFVSWMGKLQGMYSLPWDINISVGITSRQGWVIPVRFSLQDNRLPNTRSRSFSDMPISKTSKRDRLPAMAYGNIKIEKALKLGDRGRIYLSADIFNVLNSLTLNRQYAIDYGTYYLHNNYWTQDYARSGEKNEVLNPRVTRFGIRFEF